MIVFGGGGNAPISRKRTSEGPSSSYDDVISESIRPRPLQALSILLSTFPRCFEYSMIPRLSLAVGDFTIFAPQPHNRQQTVSTESPL